MFKKLIIGAVLACTVCAALPKRTNVFARSEVRCLAQNIYREARGEPLEGKIAVAAVTLNRTRDARYPKSICGVVYQKDQFSWTNKYKHTEPDLESNLVAYNFLKGKYGKMQKYPAKYYHAKHVKPIWRLRLAKVGSIGNHTFYRDKT